MKKCILIGLAIATISGAVYASAGGDCDGSKRFTENLNLDQTQAGEIAPILNSYKQVKELAISGQHEQIPAFIAELEAQLVEVLNAEQMQQFKENVGDWAASKDFSSFKMVAGQAFNK